VKIGSFCVTRDSDATHTDKICACSDAPVLITIHALPRLRFTNVLLIS
jgi:hypothetical protein